MPDQVGFYDEMTARENLNYIARLNGIPGHDLSRRVSSVLEKVGLEKVASRRVGTFSRGMRQRLGLADVLVKQPQLIIMDEPTSGLDPEASHEFLDMIRSLKDEGITILLSSHLLHQIQAICDRVGLFFQGKMVLKGTVEQLAHQVLGGAYRIQMDVEGEKNLITQALEQVPGVNQVHKLNTRVFELEAASDIRPEVAQAVISAGGRLFNLGMQIQSLDDIYSTYFKEVDHGENKVNPIH